MRRDIFYLFFASYWAYSLVGRITCSLYVSTIEDTDVTLLNCMVDATSKNLSG